jgi:diguanylate cyclase (GGDEF)-like protein
MIHPKRFEEIKASRQLPSPTGVVLKILRLVDNEDASSEEIGRVLQTDPALAGRILKYANSAYVGATKPVVAPADAVSRLGSRSVRRLALGFSLVSQYSKGKSQRFHHQRYWARSLATAIAAQMLSRATRQGNSDEIFMCGLLSDIGALALTTMHPEAYDEVLAKGEGLPLPELLKLERQTFAMDQVDLGVAMLDDWGIPDSYSSAVRQIGHPESGAKMSKLATLLDVARRIAHYCTAPDKERPQMAAALLEQSSRLDLDTAALSLMSDQVASAWAEWGKIMEVPTVRVPSLAEIVLEGKATGIASSGVSVEGGNSRMCVLLADHDAQSLAQLVHDVEAAGFETLTASDGQEALLLALETWPPIIVGDFQLPGVDGLELCRTLRKTRSGQRLYIILMTGSDNDDQIVSALDAGADDYCVKPWNPRLLTARLRAGQRAIELQQALESEKEEVREVAARLAVANRQLEQNAYTDSLTGLPNRSYARETLAQAWATAVDRDQPLVCMMLDVDHFKRVNDTYGHDVGDLVLQRTAAILRSSIRGNDVVCRVGGEEFLLICRETSLQQGLHIADRVRANVAANRIQAPGFDGTVTISVGIAPRDKAMAHPDELLKEADRAVYAAKHGGRNCVKQAPAQPGAVPPRSPSAVAARG